MAIASGEGAAGEGAVWDGTRNRTTENGLLTRRAGAGKNGEPFFSPPPIEHKTRKARPVLHLSQIAPGASTCSLLSDGKGPRRLDERKKEHPQMGPVAIWQSGRRDAPSVKICEQVFKSRKGRSGI